MLKGEGVSFQQTGVRVLWWFKMRDYGFGIWGFGMLSLRVAVLRVLGDLLGSVDVGFWLQCLYFVGAMRLGL